ncbi:MAG: Translation initiation factor IF-3 [Chlamydiae bacterium]|nr:Translation initiation factor IF-3 [Chlamydiota bacterium]
MRVNRQIRALNVRLIDKAGKQVGILTIQQAMALAESENLDLVEIAPKANPPVCKVIDYGKFRYQQTKKERESKKAQHQVKVKEIKVKPYTDEHDLAVKLKKAREFLEKGNKVRVSCMFRGRQMAHPEIGRRIVQRIIDELDDISTAEAMPKQMGRNLAVTLAPAAKKIKEKPSESKNEA